VTEIGGFTMIGVYGFRPPDRFVADCVIPNKHAVVIFELWLSGISGVDINSRQSYRNSTFDQCQTIAADGDNLSRVFRVRGNEYGYFYRQMAARQFKIGDRVLRDDEIERIKGQIAAWFKAAGWLNDC
jgi:hypothetical protein